MSDTDTPRTDAEAFAPAGMNASHDGFSAPPKRVVPTDLARQLERELLAMTQERDRLAECLKVAWRNALTTLPAIVLWQS